MQFHLISFDYLYVQSLYLDNTNMQISVYLPTLACGDAQSMNSLFFIE